MTEIFAKLAVISEPISDEDKVMYLLANLPPSYNVLVTVLESGSDTVPALETVTEWLLKEEQKLKGREEAGEGGKALLSKGTKKSFTCHYCKKPGHFKNCRKFAQAQSGEKKGKSKKSHEPMIISNALVARSRSDLIVDSGATSHMCNDRSMFTELKKLSSGDKVALGDGSSLNVAGEGTVDMDMLLDGGARKSCTLNKVLWVPELAYNLVSVPQATDAGKDVEFDNSRCEFRNESGDLIAVGLRRWNLYYLEFARASDSKESTNTAQVNKERLWRPPQPAEHEKASQKGADKRQPA